MRHAHRRHSWRECPRGRRMRVPRRHARRRARHAPAPIRHHVRRRRHAPVRHHVRWRRRHAHRHHASRTCSEERVRPAAHGVLDGAGGQHPLRRRAVALAARVLLVGVRHAHRPVAQELAVHGVDGCVAGLEGVKGDEAEAAAVALRSRGVASERAAREKGGETLAPVQKRVWRACGAARGAPCPGRASAWAC